MPTGIPPNIESSLLHEAITGVNKFIEQLQIPTWVEYKSALVQLFHDVRSVSSSIWHFGFLSLRPVCLFCMLAAQGAWKYIIRPIVLWSYRWQMSLTRFQVLLEVLAVVAFLLLYLLRRYIRRKKFAERIARWYRQKRRRAVRKYEDIFNRIAETSLLLAYIFPHVIFFTVVGLVECTSLGSWMMRAVATETYAIEFLSLWFPLARTAYVVARWKKKNNNKSIMSSALATTATDPTEVTKAVTLSERRKSDGPTIVGNGSEVSPGSRTKEMIAMLEQKSGIKTEGAVKVQSRQKRWSASTIGSSSAPVGSLAGGGMNEGMDTAHEAAAGMDLLKYWISYSLLVCLAQVIHTLPLIGRLFVPPTDIVSADVRIDYGSVGEGLGRLSAVSMMVRTWWNQRTLYASEWKFVFVAWVWLFQGLQGGGASSSGYSGPSAHIPNARKLGNSSGKGVARGYAPLDMLYDKVGTIMKPYYYAGHIHKRQQSFRALTTSPDMDRAVSGQSTTSPYRNKVGMIRSVLAKIDSFLQVAVFCKLLTEHAKDMLLRILSDGTDFVPGVVTLFMPSYFTSYGCLFAGCVVPAGYGMQCHDEYESYLYSSQKSNNNMWLQRDKLETVSNSDGLREVLEQDLARHLQYWIVYHVLVRLIFESLAGGVLYWVPLGTHFALVLILLLQLCNGADIVYRAVERELVVFGVLDAEYTSVSGSGAGDVSNTLTVRMLKRFASSIPVSESVREESEGEESGGVGENDDNGGEKSKENGKVEDVGGKDGNDGKASSDGAVKREEVKTQQEKHSSVIVDEKTNADDTKRGSEMTNGDGKIGGGDSTEKGTRGEEDNLSSALS